MSETPKPAQSDGCCLLLTVVFAVVAGIDLGMLLIVIQNVYR